MRSLSFADQLYSLGSAVRRWTIERDEQERASAERKAKIAAGRRKHCPEKSKGKTPAERILAVMAPLTAYRWGELKSATDLTKAQFASGMTFLLKKKRIDKTPDVRSSVYSLPC